MKLSEFKVFEGQPKEHAAKHVELLTGDRNTEMRFTVKGPNGYYDVIGRIDDLYDELKVANDAGANIFVVVQPTGAGGRKDEDVTGGRAVVADSDNGPLDNAACEPTFIVTSVAGPHLYFTRTSSAPPWPIDLTVEKTKAMAFKLGTDPEVATAGRIMRMAGFNHLKDPANPHMVTINIKTKGEPRTYDCLDAIKVAHVDAEAWQAYREHNSGSKYLSKVPGSEQLPRYQDKAGWIKNVVIRAAFAAWTLAARYVLCRRSEMDAYLAATATAGNQADTTAFGTLALAFQPTPWRSSTPIAVWHDKLLWCRFAFESAIRMPADEVTCHLPGGHGTPEWLAHMPKAKVWLSRIWTYGTAKKRAERLGHEPPEDPGGFSPTEISQETVQAAATKKRGHNLHEPTRGDQRTFDLAKFLRDYDLQVDSDDRVPTQTNCPFGGDNHPNSDKCARFWPAAEGKPPGFFCQHIACGDKRWPDVVRLYSAEIITEYCQRRLSDDEFRVAQLRVTGVVPLSATLHGSPYDDVLVPAPWVVREDGVYLSNKTGELQRVAHEPMVIVGFARSVDGRADEAVVVAWLRGGMWASCTVSREIIGDRSKLLVLAKNGAPVNSGNAEALVSYLADVEAANIGTAPTEHVSAALGWQSDGTFLVGDRQVLTDGTIREAGEPGTIRFIGDETVGDLQNAFVRSGTYEGWLLAISRLAPYPIAIYAFYAAFVAPLLKIFGCQNFWVELAGQTSRGKTTALRAAASVWGQSDTRGTGSVMQTWNSTKVAVERRAAAGCDLPLLLDDSQHWQRRPEELAQVVYQIASGMGRARGDKVGTRVTSRWRTVGITTGERKLADFSPGSGGDKARILSSWGDVFPGDPAQAIETVSILNRGLVKHFGWAGPMFVAYIQQNQDLWPAWQEAYEGICDRLALLPEIVMNPVAGRLAQAHAAVLLTARLVHEAIDLPWCSDDACEAAFARVLAELPHSDPPTQALRDVYSWAASLPDNFCRLPSANVTTPSQGWLGRWDEGGPLCLNTVSLKAKLTQMGYHAESVIRIWSDNGWLDAGPASKTKTVRIGTKVDKCICIKASVLGEHVVTDDDRNGLVVPFLRRHALAPVPRQPVEPEVADVEDMFKDTATKHYTQ